MKELLIVLTIFFCALISQKYLNQITDPFAGNDQYLTNRAESTNQQARAIFDGLATGYSVAENHGSR